MPSQVVYGEKSPEVLQEGSRALADLLPNAELSALPGVSHNLKMKAMAPVIAEFVAPTGEASQRDRR